MNRIPIMLNGLPGNVASTIAAHAEKDQRVQLLPYSLTGPEIETPTCQVDDRTVELIRPDQSSERLEAIAKTHESVICVDFTHPTAVNANARLYCDKGVPFVMGTTGGDRTALEQTVMGADVSAVIAPNMAKQIVGFQAMMAYAADTFPDIFKGYKMTVKESHQAGKADTSGTAKAVVASFQRMGIDFNTEQIVKVRDPDVQREQLGVPDAFIGGHGWHTYTLQSADGTVKFEFVHNISGRDIYAEGTLDAVAFLARQMANGVRGRVFTMIDVLKAS